MRDLCFLKRDDLKSCKDRPSAVTRWAAKGRFSTYGCYFRKDGDLLRDDEMYLYWAGGCSLELLTDSFTFHFDVICRFGESALVANGELARFMQ